MSEPGVEHNPKPWQFSLRSLFVLTLVLAMFLGLTLSLGLNGIVIFVLGVAIWVCVKFRREPLVLILVPLLVIIPLLNVILPSAGSREAGPISRCLNNLCQIDAALHAYESQHGSLPPAYIADASGRPMHSWRVLLLPYLDHQYLYQRYRFDEPWDGPNNRKLHHFVVPEFCCSTKQQSGKATDTSYVAVTGPETAWPGAKAIRCEDIPDGPDNTVLLIEVENSGIHWMEPRDLPLASMNLKIGAAGGNSICGHSYRGSAFRAEWGGNVLFANRVVQFLHPGIPPQTVRALFTIDGGEKVRSEDLQP